MIQPQTYLRVADNTGARELMCIRVLGGGKQRAATVGDIIIAVVKDATPNMPVKKSDVVRFHSIALAGPPLRGHPPYSFPRFSFFCFCWRLKFFF